MSLSALTHEIDFFLQSFFFDFRVTNCFLAFFVDVYESLVLFFSFCYVVFEFFEFLFFSFKFFVLIFDFAAEFSQYSFFFADENRASFPSRKEITCFVFALLNNEM